MMSVAARGISDLITRPPVPLVGEEAVRAAVGRLASTLTRADAWGVSQRMARGVDSEARARVSEGDVAFSVLAALR